MKIRRLFFFTFLLAGCKPDHIPMNQVISGLTISNRSAPADGTTIIYLSAQLNNKTNATALSIIFEASGGTFPTGNDTLITQPAVFQDGSLQARVAFKMPATAGELYFKATPAAPSPYQQFQLKDSINVKPSLPATLSLIPSAASIKTGYGSEILLTATLKNSIKNNVSTNCKVVFQDYYANGSPVNGIYRALRDTTDATSTATVSYSLGTASSNFFIKCTYLNSDGSLSSVKDSCLINVIQ